MLSFPNAKINLGLNILRKRADGYHDIESCLYPVTLSDILEIVPSPTFQFESSGLAIAGDGPSNLVIKAYRLLQAEFDLPPVAIYLHKTIPMGAGLGGGSSDGAFALRMLNDLFGLHLTIPQLEQYAAHLGSDCPFFIQNQPALATGTGTTLTPLPLDLSAYDIRFRFPQVHVSTAEAYAGVTPRQPTHSIPDILKRPVTEWQGLLQNDFEASILAKYPSIAHAKQTLHDEGAIYVAMSGSGSAVFGVFGRKVCK
jgi:4-diphosphocytidyl-2-C-methyl-D-erythritol kinase